MSTSLIHDPAWVGDVDLPGPEERENDSQSGFSGGSWPRMVVLDDETEQRLKLWLDEEIHRFNVERQPLLEDWKNYQKIYWANPKTKQKNFPFQKAANIVIPLAAIAVEANHARFMNILFSVEPFWSIRPRSKEWIPVAKPFEDYLQIEVESVDGLDMFGFCDETLAELEKLGTCVGKTGYERLTKKSIRSIGGEDQDHYVTVKDGGTVDRVPVANFIMRLAELDPQTAPLVGEKHTATWSQLKKYVLDGRMRKKAVQEIKQFHYEHHSADEPNDGDQVKREVEEQSNTEPIWYERFDFYEIWCSFDVDGDGVDEEIVVDFHKESGQFLSIRYNWYDDLHRPYRLTNYINVEGIWPGIGICKQSEQFQEEVTTIHRQRLDNATLANMAQIVIRKNTGYGPGEPIFPGKMWFLDDPQNDIREFKLSDVYTTSLNYEDSIVRYFEKRTGANEVILGLPQSGTPATATSDLTRLQEGNKRFDLVMKYVKRFLSHIGTDLISAYQTFGNQQIHFLVSSPEDGAMVEQVLRMPSVLVRRGAVVDLTVTDSITNREIEQQKWMSLFQVITNYYDRVLQMAQLFGEDVFAQLAQQILPSSSEAMKMLLSTFDITDAERFALSIGGQDENSGGVPEQSQGVGSPTGP